MQYIKTKTFDQNDKNRLINIIFFSLLLTSKQKISSLPK